MNWYLILKFIHVAAVISWLGGSGALVFAATIRSTFEQRKNVIAIVTFLSKRLFIPALVVVLLSGVTMWWVGALAFEAWVAYGLAGIVVTGVLGQRSLVLQRNEFQQWLIKMPHPMSLRHSRRKCCDWRRQIWWPWPPLSLPWW